MRDKPEAPGYIKKAIEAYILDHNPAFLLEMVDNGLNLSEFRESTDLLAKLLGGKPVRSKGTGAHKRDLKRIDQHLRAVAYCAQLHGAGLSLFSSDNREGEVDCACLRAGKRLSMSTESFKKNVWDKYKNEQWVKDNIKLGKRYPQGFDL